MAHRPNGTKIVERVLDANPIAGRESEPELVGFTPERLAWLIRLRWMALLGIVAATALSAGGAFQGVNWRVLAATAAGAAVYNASMWRALRKGGPTAVRRDAMAQALIDFLLLTVVLWAAGGLDSPFVSFYVFHVALVGILYGPRATLHAAGFALACAGLLWLTEVLPVLRIGEWRPQGFWHPLANVTAFVLTVGATAYLVTHAVAVLRDRERALKDARVRAELEYELLSTTLDELDAGLEVLDEKRNVVWKNRLARRLVPEPDGGKLWACPGTHRPCERDASGLCPIRRSFQLQEAGRCRFFAPGERGNERVYELLSFPLSTGTHGQPRVMNLYIDRTAATLAERQLVLAERLASLGRVAQGVAHELNTPLATIRTLAADMSAALRNMDASTDEARRALIGDVAESAALIKEETARLGRITHALLAGGDLVRPQIVGAVPLSAVVERSGALVFAGARASCELVVDSSVSGIRVWADSDRLVQVLVNLLQNAQDALRGDPARGGKQGTIRVSARRDAEAVEIRVDDDGAGLDPSLGGRLFEPFTTTKPPGEGTGLGLYTSYMLVKAMRGSLALTGRPQGGTRATVRLPLRPSGAELQAQGEVRGLP